MLEDFNENSFWGIRGMIFLQLSLCLFTRNMNGDNWLADIPQNALLHASTELKDKTMIGLFLSKEFDYDGKINFGLGVRKTINDHTSIKAKVDKELNSALFAAYNIGGGLRAETTVARNFSDLSSKDGFLGSSYSLGLKLKYDN